MLERCQQTPARTLRCCLRIAALDRACPGQRNCSCHRAGKRTGLGFFPLSIATPTSRSRSQRVSEAGIIARRSERSSGGRADAGSAEARAVRGGIDHRPRARGRCGGDAAGDDEPRRRDRADDRRACSDRDAALRTALDATDPGDTNTSPDADERGDLAGTDGSGLHDAQAGSAPRSTARKADHEGGSASGAAGRARIRIAGGASHSSVKTEVGSDAAAADRLGVRHATLRFATTTDMFGRRAVTNNVSHRDDDPTTRSS